MTSVTPMSAWARLYLCRWAERPMGTGQRRFGVQRLPTTEQRAKSGRAGVLQPPQPVLAAYLRQAITREDYLSQLRAHLAAGEHRGALAWGTLAFSPSWSAWDRPTILADHGHVIYCTCDPAQAEHEPACILPLLPVYLCRAGWRVTFDGDRLTLVDAWRCQACGNTGVEFYYEAGPAPGEGTERCMRCNSTELAGAGEVVVSEDTDAIYDGPR